MDLVSITVGAGSSRRVSPSVLVLFHFLSFYVPQKGSAFPLRVLHLSSFTAEGCNDELEITNKNRQF